MKRIVLWVAAVVAGVLLFSAGFAAGRITAPEISTVPEVFSVSERSSERKYFTSPRGKVYYLTRSGNKVYVRHEKRGDR